MLRRSILAVLAMLPLLISAAAATSYPVYGYQTRAVAVGDFNGDGNQDLFVSSDCDPSSYPLCRSGVSTVLLGKGDGTFGPTLTGDGPRFASFALAADFNGDGIADVAVAYECADEPCEGRGGGVKIYSWNASAGRMGQLTIIPTNVPFAAGMAVGDFDSDGRMDLAVVYQVGLIDILLSSGRSQRFELPQGPSWGVVAADLNGDGILDLAVANECAKYTCRHGAIPVLLGNGDGTFQKPFYRGVRAFAHWLGAGDMNGDGKPDLIVGGTRYLSVLLNDGDGSFRQRDYSPLWYVGLVADVNRDGIPDVVTPFTVELGNAKGGFGRPFGVGADATGESVAVGDFNGDGFVDIAATNYGENDGSVSVVLGNGDGTFR